MKQISKSLPLFSLDLFFFFFSLLVHVRTQSDLHSGGKKRPHRDFPHFIQLKKAQKPHLATAAAAASKIQHHHRNVHFFAATRTTKNHTVPPECALFCIRHMNFLTAKSNNKITPFLRNVRFFAASFFDQCALFSRSTIQQNHTFPSECALFRR